MILALAAIGVLAFWQHGLEAKDAVPWRTDLEAAMQEAAATNKLVLIDFWSPGCMYCRQMDAEVLPQQAVQKEMENFVPVKLDAFANPRTSERFEVNGLPAYIVVTPDGRRIARAEGYYPAETFVKFLQYAVQRKNAPENQPEL